VSASPVLSQKLCQGHYPLCLDLLLTSMCCARAPTSIPTVGFLCPTVGCLCPTVGRLCPTVGRLCPTVGRLCPAVGRLCPYVGRLCLTVGPLCPTVGCFQCTVGCFQYTPFWWLHHTLCSYQEQDACILTGPCPCPCPLLLCGPCSCFDIFSEAEQRELQAYREKNFAEKDLSAPKRRQIGKCPLTPEEVLSCGLEPYSRGS